MTEPNTRVYYTDRGRILFTPGDPASERRAPARLPEPPFRRRQPRPSSIHIVRFPAGYVWCPPRDPPVKPPPSRIRVKLEKLATKNGAKRAFGNLLSPWASTCALKSAATSVSSLSSDSSFSSTSSELAPPSYDTLSPLPSIPLSAPARSARSSLEIMASALSTRSMQTLPNDARGSFSSDHRNSITSITGQSTLSQSSSSGELDKPMASASGVSMNIQLAEPHVYLTGFDHDGRGHHQTQNATAMIRGKLIICVTKAVKVKAVTLTFSGKARTEWPEGIPPAKTEYHEEKALRKNVMPFYNTAFDDAENPYGAQCKYSLKSGAESGVPSDGSSSTRTSRSSTMLSAKDAKRLSLQNNQARSFEKGGSPSQVLSAAQQKGYKVFHPGTYEYSFEIPLEHTSPETTDLPLGSVKWMLETLLERAGTFKPNLHGTKEVLVVRAPDQNSLEQVEPIAISRKWEDQLHYDIVISGKSFPIGAKIPIAFKLTPLAKVQCHRIKVFVTENVDYFTEDKKVTRRDAQRKILLFERQAGKPLSEQYRESSVNFVRGGEPSAKTRQRTREVAQRRRDRESAHKGIAAQPLEDPSDNLLGDLELGLDELAIATEIEMNVQLPTCAQMKKDRSKLIHPDTTWKLIQVHHWIKIVLRLSRLDTEDPTGKKRRHFEISIDSPFHILSCLATQQHTALPEYSDASPSSSSRTFECGCPNAASTSNHSSSGSVPTLNSFQQTPELSLPQMPTMPSQAHLSEHGQNTVQRPIHLMRVPSFNPPAFDADEPPPPLPTPPPGYDMVIGTPSHDGLADYFSRFADAYSDDDDEEVTRITRNGRVNVPHPRTPGGGRLPSRSMDVDRNYMFKPEDIERSMRRHAERQGATAT